MSLTHSPISCCIVIPCYNHSAGLAQVLAQLAVYHLPCFVVDDGSDTSEHQRLQQLAASTAGVTLLQLAHNSGKGAAVLHGLQAAAQAGYSHALQIDADGQHNVQDVPKMLLQARQYPTALISGRPVYDAAMPRARRYGRWLTHVWVWIETLSLSIEDSMCGFRIYPLAATLALAARYPAIGKRMDFDIEIMVRLYWLGHDCRFVPTRVQYPPGGVSHFKALQDNLKISWLHCRLVFGMLVRIPALLTRQRRQHWAQRQEVKGLWGMRFMLLIYQFFGRTVFSVLLYPVVAVYWLLARDSRLASQQWLARVRRVYQQNDQQPPPERLNSYRHFLRFANAMLDKIASWRGELRLGKQVVFAPGSEQILTSNIGRGMVLLASHLGDAEVCRALAQHLNQQTITALVFHQNARNFKRVMEQLAPQAAVNLLPVSSIGPDTAMLLKQRIDNGEWVAIVGDRIAVNPQRDGHWHVSWSEFMEKPAPFPQGPFILTALLRCPVTLLFALRQQKQLRIYCEPFARVLELPRADRQQALQQVVDRYAARLQHYALLSPLDWFNFFDFWQLPENIPVIPPLVTDKE